MLNRKISDCLTIWIDHRAAILVYFPGDRFQNGKNVWIEEGLNGEKRDHSLQHRNGHHQEALKHYYKHIIDKLRHMVHINDIIIMGPGQAKYELRRHIDQHKFLKGKIRSIQNASQMSEAEIKTLASQYYYH